MILLAIGFLGGRRSARDSGSDAGTAATAVGGPDLSYPDLAEDSRPAIAVLPFADMSPGGDQEYFRDGVSAEILSVLARIPDLRVAARSSAFRYKGRRLDLRRVGEEFGVPFSSTEPSARMEISCGSPRS